MEDKTKALEERIEDTDEFLSSALTGNNSVSLQYVLENQIAIMEYLLTLKKEEK